MKEKSKNLIVLFPGGNYAVTKPLLYYAALKYTDKGYECIGIQYGEFHSIEETQSVILAQIKGVDFAACDEIIFVSKSVGTIYAGWLAEKLDINVRQVFLSPIEKTLPYIWYGNSIVIAGSKDPMIDIDMLTAHCKRENVALELIPNANHNLIISGDVDQTVENLARIIRFY
jgi:hypothetical protein